MKEPIIEKVKLSEIRPNPSNPRELSREKFDELVKSIKDFPKMLSAEPIKIADGVILSGNQRYQALKRLGHKEAYVQRLDHFTEEERLEYIIKANVHSGIWDWDMLANGNEWDEYQLNEWGLDVWQPEEDNKKGLTDPDDVPEVPEEPKTKLGDLYILGDHRVLCGDSTKAEDVERLMNGESADIIYTDPPYSSGGFQESGKGTGSIGARGGVKIENDNLSTRGYIALMDKTIMCLRSAHSIFVFCDWKMWTTNQDLSESKGYRTRNMIVWDKGQMGMGMPFRNQHELCLFGSKISGKIGDGKTPNVLAHKRDREAEHATPKPVGLILDMLKQIDGKNVADPFMGGGSTLIACETIGRKCYGMELDPKYCDVIVKRWEDFTGKKAEKM